MKNIMIEDKKSYKKNKSIHEEKVHGFFDHIISGCEIYIQFSKVPDILKNEFKFEEDYIEVSILSEEMIKYDKENLGNNKSEYRPYFSFFEIEMTESNLDKICGLKNLDERIFLAKLCDEESIGENKDVRCVFEGTYITSASPINCIKKRLIVFNDSKINSSQMNTINTIKKDYDYKQINTYTPVDEIQNIMDSVWKSDYPRNIDIYNVGHGNADYIRGNKARMLYDVGYNYRCIPSKMFPKFPRAANALRNVKPSCVILSHWDLDHIIGCAYAKKDLFNCKWIVPELISNNNVNAMRLAMYLKKKGNLCVVDRKDPTRIIAKVQCDKDFHICLWQCAGKDPYVTSKENCYGLILEFVQDNGNFHTLLAGDVPYNCIGKGILNNAIDFLHVPHHCSKMELNCLSSMKPGSNPFAVITTNWKKDGKYNQNDDHVKVLKNIFSNILYPIGNNLADTEKYLSVQYDCIKKTCKFR